jgi:hypothetical protein
MVLYDVDVVAERLVETVEPVDVPIVVVITQLVAVRLPVLVEIEVVEVVLVIRVMFSV